MNNLTIEKINSTNLVKITAMITVELVNYGSNRFMTRVVYWAFGNNYKRSFYGDTVKDSEQNALKGLMSMLDFYERVTAKRNL